MTTPRLTRSQWGARPSEDSTPTRVASTKGTGVHWVGPKVWGSAGPAGRHSLCAGKVRGIQRAHQAGEWKDIAYSEIVCPHGTRYEGRGYHVQTGANGSAYANAHYYAILALVGEGDPITSALLEGLSDAAEAYRVHGDAGSTVTWHGFLLATYAGRSTACPGPALTAQVKAGRFRHVEPAPKPAPPTTTKENTVTTLVRLANAPAVFVSNLVQRRWVQDPAELAVIQSELKARGLPSTVRLVKDLDPYGVLVGPAPAPAK